VCSVSSTAAYYAAVDLFVDGRSTIRFFLQISSGATTQSAAAVERTGGTANYKRRQ